MNAYLSACFLLICLLIIPQNAAAHFLEQTAHSACLNNDCSKDLRRLFRLARISSGDASVFAAMAYAHGDGLEQNTERAIHYLKIGLRQRNPAAVNLMSDWLRSGFLVEHNSTEAALLLKRAIKLNYAPAQYTRAIQLLETEDPAVLPEALSLLEKASSQRFASAMLLFNQLKQHGVETKKDLAGTATLN